MEENIIRLENSSNLKSNLVCKTRFDLQQRYELRNNYYHRKLPLLLDELCIIKSNKDYFQLIKNEYHQSKQCYKKLCNIPSLSSENTETYEQLLQQSIQIMNNLKNDVKQCENSINQLKSELIQKNHDLNYYASILFQTQCEKNLLQTDVKQLNQQILFENQCFNEVKQQYSNVNACLNTERENYQKTFQQTLHEVVNEFYEKQHNLKHQEILIKNNLENIKDLNQHQLNELHTEFIKLSTLISNTEVNLKNKLNDLLPLQSELDGYRRKINTIAMNHIRLKTQTVTVPIITKMNKREVTQESTPYLNKINKTILHSVHNHNQGPLKPTNESESTTAQEKQSKANSLHASI